MYFVYLYFYSFEIDEIKTSSINLIITNNSQKDILILHKCEFLKFMREYSIQYQDKGKDVLILPGEKQYLINFWMWFDFKLDLHICITHVLCCDLTGTITVTINIVMYLFIKCNLLIFVFILLQDMYRCYIMGGFVYDFYP